MNPVPTAALMAPTPPAAGLGVPEVKLLMAGVEARNAEVVGQVVDDSIEASARARREREAEQAEQRAEEARQARIDEIERRERAEAEAASEERRRFAAEVAARREENEARWSRAAAPTLLDAAGRLDAQA